MTEYACTLTLLLWAYDGESSQFNQGQLWNLSFSCRQLLNVDQSLMTPNIFTTTLTDHLLIHIDGELNSQQSLLIQNMAETQYTTITQNNSNRLLPFLLQLKILPCNDFYLTGSQRELAVHRLLPKTKNMFNHFHGIKTGFIKLFWPVQLFKHIQFTHLCIS